MTGMTSVPSHIAYEFVEEWTQSTTMDHIAPHLTEGEASALSALLYAFGAQQDATDWADLNAQDEEQESEGRPAARRSLFDRLMDRARAVWRAPAQ